MPSRRPSPVAAARTARPLLLLAALFSVPQACERHEERPVETHTTSARASLLEPARLGEALRALLEPLPQPVRILTVTALHGQVILQVQANDDPARVAEYRYRDGKIIGPTDVTLLGAGKLQDNLFPLQAAHPQVASLVLTAVAREYPGLPVKKLVMIRNLPRSRDIQFEVFLDGPGGLLLVKADKNGRLLGPPEPATEATQAVP